LPPSVIRRWVLPEPSEVTCPNDPLVGEVFGSANSG